MKKVTHISALLLALIMVAGLISGCGAAPLKTDTSAVYPAEEPGAAYSKETAAGYPSEEAEADGWNGGYYETPYEPAPNDDFGAEEYGSFEENKYFSPLDQPLSTFSIDVDTASYSQIRRYLNEGSLPPTDAVRIEECINYFSYNYVAPSGPEPVNVGVTISDCPWNDGRYLARITLKAAELNLSEAPSTNLVFLLDVSGSMDDPDKLPLVKSAMSMLAGNLSDKDRVSIVVYAGASGVVLDGCSGSDNAVIDAALERLSAGGSTAGGEGIALAYAIAEKNFIQGGNNRVILCTDGDFNVGPSSTNELESLIENKRSSGIYLSVLGFGTGNTKDNKMETLADKGNGNYAYIDSLMEAKKVLVNEISSTLFTVAKDVKVQVEFNPDAIKEYRLIGYDNRVMAAEDFNNDKKDAGEMGAGHCVTAFYELIPVNSNDSGQSVDALVFQDNSEPLQTASAKAGDWLYVKFRYKQPDSDKSQLMTTMAGIKNYTAKPDNDFVFASAVAEFALALKNSDYQGSANLRDVIERAQASRGTDEDGYRAQFIQMAELAYTFFR